MKPTIGSLTIEALDSVLEQLQAMPDDYQVEISEEVQMAVFKDLQNEGVIPLDEEFKPCHPKVVWFLKLITSPCYDWPRIPEVGK